MDLTDIILILSAFILVLMNAFFVAAEFSMVKLRRSRVVTIKDSYGVRGRILAHIHKHLDAYLSACQLGITLASLGLGWIGEPVFAQLLKPLLTLLGVKSLELISAMSFLIAFLFLTFLHIVVGELMPKSLAIRQSEKVSVWTAIPLYSFYWVMYPAIATLNACSNYLLKTVGLSEIDSGDLVHTSEEIKYILSASHLHGELSEEEVAILEHTLDFADLNVIDMMRPAEEMISINLDSQLKTTLKMVIDHRFSRYPVYDNISQEFVGIIHMKDLFAKVYQDGKIKEIKTLLRPILKIPRHLPALDLLRNFREGMTHFALIFNERKKLIGFVTLDNLLHVIIGRIKDEFHRTREDWL